MSFDDLVVSFLGYIPMGDKIIKYYNENDVFKRFFKYGVSISIQFWILRAPLVWWLTGVLPDTINIFFHQFPGYLLASFVIGTVLTIGGFFINEYWVWIEKIKKKD